MKTNTSELKSGWLEADMKRAAEQVLNWKIRKFEAHFETDEPEQKAAESTADFGQSQEVISC